MTDANTEIVWGLALVEEVVLDDPDWEGLVLLFEVGGDFDGYASEFVAAGATEDAVEVLFHLGEEGEGDVEVLGGDFEVVAEGEGGKHAELEDLHGLGSEPGAQVRGRLGAFVAVVDIPCGVTLAGMVGHPELASEGLEGPALMDNALAKLDFLGTARRKGARLVKSPFPILKNAAASEAGLDDAGFLHVEGGFGDQGSEKNEVGAIDKVGTLVFGVITEFFVNVVDVVEEIDPVFGGLIDEVYEFVGDDRDWRDFAGYTTRSEGFEGAVEDFGGIFVRAAGESAEKSFGSFNGMGEGDVSDVGD